MANNNNNNSDTFKCGIHDFSTNDITKWDTHCAKKEHEYDVHTTCANKCGKKIHIKVTQKLAADANRIPRGYMCSDCKEKVQNVEIIEET